MRWRLILKEFGSELKYIKGENKKLPTLSLALKIVQIKRSSTSMNSMATMTRICLTAPILFVITILPKHRKLMLN